MIVVFGGPSIHGIDDALLEGLEVRAPALCGDLLRAVHDGAKVIGLIDGVFESVASVWHKEILFALSRDVAVLGSSSMGALRAAECRAFGMIGVGAIYEDYAAGRRCADADVAVSHAPAELGFQPLSLALVDAEYTLNALKGSGALSAQDHAAALASARSMHFKDRTWNTLITGAFPEERHASALVELVTSVHHSRKTLDAGELLTLLQSGKQMSRSGPDFDLSVTQYLARLRDATLQPQARPDPREPRP